MTERDSEREIGGVAGGGKPRKAKEGVFVSYARRDGKHFAGKLRDKLESLGFKVWQDITGMEAGHDWWLQITEAIDNVRYMVLVITPAALESKTVRKEWRYARQQGVCVVPVWGTDDHSLREKLPHWMQDYLFYDIGLDTHNFEDGVNWQSFISNLWEPCKNPHVPFMVEGLGADFVRRDEELDALIDLLLDDDRDEPKAITSALRGAGGYGKTTLARAICHDERVQQAFDDGILWVTLGETPGSLIEKVNDLILVLSGERYSAQTIDVATTRLRELLADRDILLVIDDVWNAEHLNPFLQGGERCARLITTRNDHVLPKDKPLHKVRVDKMKASEAISLVAYDLPADQVSAARSQLGELAESLFEHPLSLKLANGVLHERVNDRSQSLNDALKYARDLMDEFGLDLDDQSPAVSKVLGLSFAQLSEEDFAHYVKLAIFPEDADVPLATLEKLWGLNPIRVERFCERLERLSLLLNFDVEQRTIRLHDVVRSQLRSKHAGGLNGLQSANGAFLDAYRLTRWADMPADEPYLWDWLAYHLTEAGWAETLTETALDLWYVARKTYLRGAAKTESDLGAADDEKVTLLKSQYANMAHILSHCQSAFDVTNTLVMRLEHLDPLKENCAALEQKLKGQPHITAWRTLPDLPHPALIRTFTGHTGGVTACAFSPDGSQLISASWDNTLKLWDVNTAQLIRAFTGHTREVTACAFSPDGAQLISASDDRTLKLWDVNTAQLIRAFTGHTREVTACAFSPDGSQLISASWDNTLKLWDVNTAQLIRAFDGHTSIVTACAFSPDGAQLISASWDNTLRLWDVNTAQLIRAFDGHTRVVTACAFSPDGAQLISASWDNTLRLWDVNTAQLIRAFHGHTWWVTACAFSPDGAQLISASWDNTLRLWDVNAAQLIRAFDGHTSIVTACAFSPDGAQLISASVDRTLKLWDVNTAQRIRAFDGHTGGVTACAFSPDGSQLISASDDRTLKLWDVNTAQLIRAFDGHTRVVTACAFSPDGAQLISASWDNTLKLWDVNTAQLIRAFDGHTSIVTACAFSPDGSQLISASDDRTLKLWDVNTAQLIRAFTGHTREVTACAFSPDGAQLISASWDNTLRLWDVNTAQLIRAFDGHTWWVTACAFSPDGAQLISASWDNTLRLWDVNTAQLIRAFDGHTWWVTACAFSPDGSQLISASDDRTLKLWDAATGMCLATFYADVPLWCCAFAPQGDPDRQHIVAGGGGGYLYWLRVVGV